MHRTVEKIGERRLSFRRTSGHRRQTGFYPALIHQIPLEIIDGRRSGALYFGCSKRGNGGYARRGGMQKVE